ncbi:hypothetical protein CR513_23709, partial [Mucuna pruriens]
MTRHQYLGIELIQSKNGNHAMDILKETRLMGAKPIDTLMYPNAKLLLEHKELLLDLGKYIKGAPTKDLLYEDKGHTQVIEYSDTNYAGSPTTKRSTPARNNVVARSSAEAEYQIMASITSQIVVQRPEIWEDYADDTHFIFNPQHLNTFKGFSVSLPPTLFQYFGPPSWNQYNTQRPQFHNQPSAMVTNIAPASSCAWYSNSSASFHVTGDSQNIQQLGPFEGSDQIFIGNGQVSGQVGPRWTLSISKSSPQTLSSGIQQSSCLVSDYVNHIVVSYNSQFLWHARLGHPHNNTLKLVLKQCNIPHSNRVVPQFCSTCCVVQVYGKIVVWNFPQNSANYRGDEFRPLTKYLAHLGIIRRLIYPHTHHQNDVSHSTFLSTTLSFFIKPQITTSSRFLVVLVFLSFDPTTLILDFRSHECLFLGYSTSHKGYKCLFPMNKLFISKDVVFNELYNDLFSSTSSSPPIPSSTLPFPLFVS